MSRSYTVEWNPKARRYAFRTSAGGYGFLSEEKVRSIIDNDIDISGARMGKHGDTLKTAAQARKDERISESAYHAAVRDYRDAMASQIKGAHVGQAASAVGGIENMGPREHGRCGGLLGVQYRYLENACAEFAADPDLVLGEVSGRQGVDGRGEAYANASRATFERFSDIASGEGGMVWAINILESSAHHCGKGNEVESCIGQSNLGAVRYDDPRRRVPGQRICNVRCRCGSRRFKTKQAAMAVIGA